VGLVGAGNVAQRHARVLSQFDDVELVGVADLVPEVSRRLAGQYGVRAFAEVAALLEADLDAVYVCVPPFAHGPVEEAVIAAGLPMFVEKPIAADLETAARIASLVAERGTLTSVGHHWWCRRDESGGPVIEQAAHVLDLTRLLAGEVTQVTAYGDGWPPPVDGADIDAVTAAALRFTSGAVGTLTSACVLLWKHCAELEILADGLALRIGEDELVIREGNREDRFPGDPEAARVAVDRAFVDAVRGVGDDIRVPYAEALRTHRLACAVAESAATGSAMRLDGAGPALARMGSHA
jgi:predicted dehydrogenase